MEKILYHVVAGLGLAAGLAMVVVAAKAERYGFVALFAFWAIFFTALIGFRIHIRI